MSTQQYLYVPAGSRTSRKDIEASSYTTTPSRSPDHTPDPSGQACYHVDPPPPKPGRNYNYVPASSRTSRKDIDESSYTTTPSRTPGQRTPLSGQSCYANGPSSSLLSSSSSRGAAPGMNVRADQTRVDIRGSTGVRDGVRDGDMGLVARPNLSSRRSVEMVDSALRGLQDDDRDVAAENQQAQQAPKEWEKNMIGNKRD